jgi:hypothetical protein
LGKCAASNTCSRSWRPSATLPASSTSACPALSILGTVYCAAVQTSLLLPSCRKRFQHSRLARRSSPSYWTRRICHRTHCHRNRRHPPYCHHTRHIVLAIMITSKPEVEKLTPWRGGSFRRVPIAWRLVRPANGSTACPASCPTAPSYRSVDRFDACPMARPRRRRFGSCLPDGSPASHACPTACPTARSYRFVARLPSEPFGSLPDFVPDGSLH